VCDSQKSTTVKEYTYVFNSRIISYILNILIYVSMIMLDSLLQHPSVPDLPLPNPCVGALANSASLLMGHQIFELGMTFMVDDTMRQRRGGELVKGQG
jgi:hypothetical protein